MADSEVGKENDYIDISKLHGAVKKYDSEVITPKFGEGYLRDELLENLERILIQSFQHEIFSREIDLGEIGDLARKKGYKNIGRKIKNFLERAGVKTYGQLCAFMRERKEKGPYAQYVNAQTDTETEERLMFCQVSRGVGRPTIEVLFEHLESQNVRAFGRDYTSEDVRILSH